jgi:arabinan endo-1,5-alpha-L-arabinosidase
MRAGHDWTLTMPLHQFGTGSRSVLLAAVSVLAAMLAVVAPGRASAARVMAGSVAAELAAGPAASWPQAFTNPVFRPDLPDPSIIQDPSTGLWYAYGTTDYWTSSPSSLHILPILSSRNLVDWTFVRNTFSPSGTTPVTGSPTQAAWTGSVFLWAPNVRFIDGQYVMYYAASSTAAGGSAIGVATASSPAGPWHDSGGPIAGPQPNPQGGYYSIIDPDEISTPGGQRYLYYGSFDGGVYVVPLQANGLAVQPGSTPVQVASAGIYEGADVVYHDGYYYLFASSGGCCSGPNSGYEEVAGRSRSPLGPFTDRLGIPMTQGGVSVVLAANGDHFVGTGSGRSVFQDDAGQWWMAMEAIQQQNPYLSSEATRRPLALEPVEWGPDGWPTVNGGLGVTEGPQPAPVTSGRGPSPVGGPGLVQRAPEPGRLLTAYSEDFDTAQLGPQWSWLNEDTANWSLSSDPGSLTIDGQAGQFYETEHSGQNVLLEKAPPGNFIVQTRVALDPAENYQQAGLVLWQDDDTWMKLVAESNSGIDVTEWGKQTDVTSSDAGFNCGPNYPVSTCPVYGSGFLEVPGFSAAARAAGGSKWAWLRIVRTAGLITAYTSINGQAWTPGATYNLRGFSRSAPLEIGILATGAGAAAPIPAHFSYVHVYRPCGVPTISHVRVRYHDGHHGGGSYT